LLGIYSSCPAPGPGPGTKPHKPTWLCVRRPCPGLSALWLSASSAAWHRGPNKGIPHSWPVGVTISCGLNGSLRSNKIWTHMLVNVLRRSVTDLAQCKLIIRPPFEWQASLGDPQHPQHPKYPARALHLTGRALEILIRLSSCSIFISQSDGYWPDSNSSLLSN